MTDLATVMATDERATLCICRRRSVHSRRCDQHAARVADLYAAQLAQAEARVRVGSAA